MIGAVQSPYALATPVVECVEDALKQEQLLIAERAVAEIVSERQRLMREIKSLDFVRKVWPSAANFFLVEVNDVGSVLRRCEEHRILLRHFGGALASCLRISVGSPADNTELLRVLNTLRNS